MNPKDVNGYALTCPIGHAELADAGDYRHLVLSRLDVAEDGRVTLREKEDCTLCLRYLGTSTDSNCTCPDVFLFKDYDKMRDYLSSVKKYQLCPICEANLKVFVRARK